MGKEKFVLTDDLIKVETEPHHSLEQIHGSSVKNHVPKDRISLNIDRDLKTELHLHCVVNKRPMTEVIEDLIRVYLTSLNKQ